MSNRSTTVSAEVQKRVAESLLETSSACLRPGSDSPGDAAGWSVRSHVRASATGRRRYEGFLGESSALVGRLSWSLLLDRTSSDQEELPTAGLLPRISVAAIAAPAASLKPTRVALRSLHCRGANNRKDRDDYAADRPFLASRPCSASATRTVGRGAEALEFEPEPIPALNDSDSHQPADLPLRSAAPIALELPEGATVESCLTVFGSGSSGLPLSSPTTSSFSRRVVRARCLRTRTATGESSISATIRALGNSST